jgi:carbohydrate-selective porin OprB
VSRKRGDGGLAGRGAVALLVVFAVQVSPPSAFALETVSSSSLVGRLERCDHLLLGVDAARAALKRAGLELSLFYNAFTGFRLAGGERGERVEQSGSADFFAVADLDRLGLRGAGTLLLQVKALHDRNVNPSIAALSDPIDDADGDDFYLDQLWIEQPFFDHRLHWRIGYLDQQVLIDRNAYANNEDRQFFSTALDNANLVVPVGVGLGTALSFEPVWWLRFVYTMSDAQGRAARAGWDTAFDGFDAHFHVVEVTILSRLPGRHGPLGGNYRLGGIFDPRPRRKFGAPPAPAAAPQRTHQRI